MKQPTLSVCMIIKDVEEVLARCLDSLAGMYDELCIVDTGSSDRSLEVARRYTHSVTAFTLCNDEKGRIVDFALARNHCLAMAKSDWILSIDGDEVFRNDSGEALKGLLAKRTEKAVALTVSRGQTQWVAIRLFRNLPEHNYQHAVHELVSVSGEVATLRSLVIQDLGQSQKPEVSAQRNERICSLLLAKHPHDLRALFYRAEARRKQGKWTQAIGDYLDCLEHPLLSIPYRCATLEALALCFMQVRRFQEAKDAARMVTELHPGLAESHCLMGDASLAMHDIASAKQCYQRAAQQDYPPKDYNLFVRQNAYDTYPLNQLENLKTLCEKHGLDYEHF